METIGKIRRRRLVQGESISAIARDLGLSRNTVKRAAWERGFLVSSPERARVLRNSQPLGSAATPAASMDPARYVSSE